MARAGAAVRGGPRGGRAARGLPCARPGVARRDLSRARGSRRRISRGRTSACRRRRSVRGSPPAGPSATSSPTPSRAYIADHGLYRTCTGGLPPRDRHPPRDQPGLPNPDGLPSAHAAPGRTTCPRSTSRAAIVELAEDKKAADIVLLDLTGLTTMADYFVIASGGSERQLDAIADGVISGMRDDEGPRRSGGRGRPRRTGCWSTSGR